MKLDILKSQSLRTDYSNG